MPLVRAASEDVREDHGQDPGGRLQHQGSRCEGDVSFLRESPLDKALLDFVEKLTRRPDRMTRDDIEALRGQGFADAQILEAVQVTALSAFLNCLAAGLGTVPDEIQKATLTEE